VVDEIEEHRADGDGADVVNLRQMSDYGRVDCAEQRH
jgi:hypothetical protein